MAKEKEDSLARNSSKAESFLAKEIYEMCS